jgi:uncharacterized membrane protein
MFFVRFLLLAFLVAYSYSMGQIGSSGLNAFGKLVSSCFFIFAPAFYMLPTFEAWKKKHKNLSSIAILNIFLGWSVLGWVAAVIWAYKKSEAYATVNPSVKTDVTPYASSKSIFETKQCPFCAEEIHVQAIKCKHCSSSISLLKSYS